MTLVALFAASAFGASFGQPILVNYDRIKNETIVHAQTQTTALRVVVNIGAPIAMVAVKFEGNHPNTSAKIASILVYVRTMRAPPG